MLICKKNKKKSFKKCRSKKHFFCCTSVAKAFTLIELLFVVVIVLMMSGVLLFSVNKNKGTSEVENAANQVVAILRSAQNDAVNGRIANDGKPICRFELYAWNGWKKMEVYYYNCASNTVSSQTLPFFSAKGEGGNVTSSADAVFTFTSPRGDVNSGSVVLTNGSVSYYVCVVAGGSSGGSNIYAKKTSCP